MTTNRNNTSGGGRRSAGTPRMRRGRRGCPCQDGEVDYKDAAKMRRFVNERGKIGSPRRTGATAKCQRELAIAVKRARHLALIPMAPHHRHLTESVQDASQQSRETPASDQATTTQSRTPVAVSNDSGNSKAGPSKPPASPPDGESRASE